MIPDKAEQPAKGSSGTASKKAERRLEAIMLADIAGYSALMERDESRTFERVRALREQVIAPKVDEFGGRIVKTTGDGFLAEFPSATAALGCGIMIQRMIFAQEADNDEAERIHMRIGINLGDIISDGDDVSGDGVNVAARLEPLAPLDGICVSGAVRDQVREDFGAVFEDLGDQQVKNISRPIRAYRINLANVPVARPARPRRSFARPWIAALASVALVVLFGAGGLLYLRSTSKPAAPPFSLVVLPLESVSHDPDQEAFADALTEDLTNALGKFPASFVIASSTAATYKGKPIDVRHIGRELGVRYALEGSVQKLGTNIRVDARLIDAESGGQIWAEQFNGDITRLEDLHDEVKWRFARSLDIAIAADVGRRSERQPDNADAVSLLLRAHAILNRPLSEQGFADARKLLDQALAIDPDLAQALIDRAFTDVGEDAFFHGAIPLDNAEQWLARARELAPDNIWARYHTAFMYEQKGDLDRAAFYAEQAIAIDPSFPYAYGALSRIRTAQGRAIEAIPLVEKALQLSPRDPFLDVRYRDVGFAYLLLGRDEEAVRWLEKAVATNDKVWSSHLDLASAYALTGRIVQAHEELAAAERLFPGLTVEKVVALQRKLSSNETYLKQLDHLIAGLRLASLPET